MQPADRPLMQSAVCPSGRTTRQCSAHLIQDALRVSLQELEELPPLAHGCVLLVRPAVVAVRVRPLEDAPALDDLAAWRKRVK